MLELVEYLAKSLVDDPSCVRVSQKEEGDMGKVIGKQGRIAKAIRTVVKAASARTGKKYTVEIV